MAAGDGPLVKKREKEYLDLLEKMRREKAAASRRESQTGPGLGEGISYRDFRGLVNSGEVTLAEKAQDYFAELEEHIKVKQRERRNRDTLLSRNRGSRNRNGSFRNRFRSDETRDPEAEGDLVGH